jgi:hypothetical protein
MNAKETIVNKLMKDGLNKDQAESEYKNIHTQIMNMIYNGRGVCATEDAFMEMTGLEPDYMEEMIL